MRHLPLLHVSNLFIFYLVLHVFLAVDRLTGRLIGRTSDNTNLRVVTMNSISLVVAMNNSEADAHVLRAGWEVVVVVKKSIAPPTRNPIGAGLNLDTVSQKIVNSWLRHPHLLQTSTLSLSIDLNEATDGDKNIRWTLARDENLNFIAAHWADLHSPLYSGYCAWRGVLKFSDNEHSEAMIGIREAYPDLGKCLYFNLGYRTHTMLFELLHKKINWIWYVNRPEPELERNSVTMKVSNDMIKEMYEEAEKVWVPEMVKLMKETEEPFINVIYDCDPLEQIVWDNAVLVGDAAYPISPHSSRSTNMEMLHAAVFGKCLEKREQKICIQRSENFSPYGFQLFRSKYCILEKRALPWRCSFNITLDNMFHLLEKHCPRTSYHLQLSLCCKQ
ncbi:hypothetical protein ACSBR2_019900 [Camellia fascicularis]